MPPAVGLSPSATKAATTTPILSRTPEYTAPARGTKPVLAASLVLTGHTDAVTLLAWSPDGAWLATGAGGLRSNDFGIRLWRPDGSLARVLTGHTRVVLALAWSPDGRVLATGSGDGTIRLWQPDGASTKTRQGHAGQVFGLAWSPDGKILASGSIVTVLNPTVQWWNDAGQIVKTLATSFSGGKFYNLSWSPDGRYLVGGATDYKEWDANGQQVGEVAACARCTPSWAMAWSLDSQRWAIGNESGDVQIYSSHGDAIANVADRYSVTQLAWSPDSKILAGAKTLWRADGSVLADLIGQPQYVNAAAWSPDGQLLATGGRDGSVHLWAPDGTPLSLLSGHTGPIEALAWAPAGRLLASASDDKTIRLWVLN
jgi:WD40 repeat protein